MRIMLEACSKIVQRIALFICPQTGIITLILYIIKKPILIVLALLLVFITIEQPKLIRNIRV